MLKKKTVMIDKITKLSVINSNARSLSPKIDCLLDCMEEHEAGISIIMETWLGEATSWILRSLWRWLGWILCTETGVSRPVTKCSMAGSRFSGGRVCSISRR